MFASRIPRESPELGIPNILDVAEVEKRGNTKRHTKRKENAVPTPYRFNFTQPPLTGLKYGNARVQLVTNFLKINSGPGKPGPYKSKSGPSAAADEPYTI
jgi:hypothetical protein